MKTPLSKLSVTAAALFAYTVLPNFAAAQAPGAGQHTACPAWSPAYVANCYHDYAELTKMLQDMAGAFPNLARLSSAGKTYQGREIWVLTITDRSTGEPETKPGVYIEGGVDSDEVIAPETALATAHRLLTAGDSATVAARQTRTYYIAPNIMPDTSELYHHTPLRPTDSTMRPYDEDSDGLVDEDPPEDLDRDGEVTMMRWVDPTGPLVLDPRDSRLMRPRRIGDAGPFYRTANEGTDNDGDGELNEDWLGGVDPNRNYPFLWNAKEQKGAGLYPGSEREIHALLEFNVAHPNIASSVHFHSAGGVVLYPFGVQGVKVPQSDMALYKDVARQGLKVTGFSLGSNIIDWRWPAGTEEDRKPNQVWRGKDDDIKMGAPPTSVAMPTWVPGSYPAWGSSADTTYPLFGVLTYGMELYEMAKDLNGDGKVDDVDRLIQSDKNLKGVAFKPWTKFRHPSLGEVEIGGWTKQGWNNPLPASLPVETKRGVEFAILLGEVTPLLRVSEVMVTKVAGAYRVTADISNLGQQPTELAIREGQVGLQQVKAGLELPAGAALVSSKLQQTLGRIDGHSSKSVEWVVSAPAGSQITIVASHPKGGTARRKVTLN